jgi:hypothetical protein
MISPVSTVDVAHPPRPPDAVEEDLERALRSVRASPSLRLLKVIHGYGSSGKGGATKTVARNWAFCKRTAIHAVIDGEQYSLFDQVTQTMRKEVGEYEDADLRVPNPGICVLWVK